MDKNKVYAVKYADTDRHTSLAVDCQPWRVGGGDDFDGIAYTVPGGRGHMIEGAVVAETGDGFTFRSTGYAPGDWDFTEVTIENFRERFGDIIMADERLDSVRTTEELQQYFNSLY